MKPKIMKSYHTEFFQLTYDIHEECWELRCYDSNGEEASILLEEGSLEDLGKLGVLINGAD
jgi:hypothetical protein